MLYILDLEMMSVVLQCGCQEATYVKRVSKECVYLLFTYSYSVKDFVTNRSVFICSSDVLAILSISVLTNKIKHTLE